MASKQCDYWLICGSSIGVLKEECFWYIIALYLLNLRWHIMWLFVGRELQFYGVILIGSVFSDDLLTIILASAENLWCWGLKPDICSCFPRIYHSLIDELVICRCDQALAATQDRFSGCYAVKNRIVFIYCYRYSVIMSLVVGNPIKIQLVRNSILSFMQSSHICNQLVD